MRPCLARLFLLLASLALGACGQTFPRIEAPPAGFVTDEGEAAYHVFIAELAYQRADYPTAASEYLRAARLSTDTEIARRAVTVAMMSDEHEIAWEASSLWVTRAADNPDSHRTRVQIAMRTGRAQASLPHLEYLLANGAQDREAAWLTILFLLGAEEDDEESLAALSDLAAAHPEEAEGQFAVAALALEANQVDAALAAADRAIALAPDWPRAGMMRARALLAAGEVDAGIAAARTVVAAHDDPEVALEFAGLLADQDLYDGARAVLAGLLQAEPDMPDALYAFGLLELRAGRPEQARVHLTNLLSTGERRLDALYFLANAAEQLDEKADALQLYLRIRSGRHYTSAQFQIGRLLFDLGQRDAAFDHLERYARRFPEQRESVLLVQGGLLSSSGEAEAAIDLYSEALEEQPDARSLRYARALLYERIDQVDLALEDLFLLVETQPEDSSALNALGYTLADRTDRYEEAYGYIKRALQMRPDEGPVLDSMGWVHYRLGNFAQALEFLQRAWAVSQDPEIGAHLGEVLWVQGDSAAARAIWAAAQQADAENRTLVETLNRFLGDGHADLAPPVPQDDSPGDDT